MLTGLKSGMIVCVLPFSITSCLLLDRFRGWLLTAGLRRQKGEVELYERSSSATEPFLSPTPFFEFGRGSSEL